MEEIKVKYCSKCKENKPIDQFSPNKTRKDGYHNYCKLCSSNYHKNKYASDSNFRLIVRNNGLKFDHNITPEEYEKMFNEQEGKCAICGKPQSNLKKALHVDHNHKTNKIRGLLCNMCNRGLGFFYDNIELLKSATSYLENN